MPNQENLIQCQWCHKYFYPEKRKYNCCTKECKEKLVGLVRQKRMAKGKGERETTGKITRNHKNEIEYRTSIKSPIIYPVVIENPRPGYSANWKEISKEIKERDKYTCQYCRVVLGESSSELETHHIVAHRYLRDYPFDLIEHPDNLIALCSTCHPLVEKGHLRLPSEVISKAYKLFENYKKPTS